MDSDFISSIVLKKNVILFNVALDFMSVSVLLPCCDCF